MKRVWKQGGALVGASVLFLSYQNCGKAVRYTTTETVYESASSNDPWANMGEFAKNTQIVSMSTQAGFQMCYPSACMSAPVLNLNFAAQTYSFTFEYDQRELSAGAQSFVKTCDLQGTLDLADEIQMKRMMDTITMHQESRSRCQTDSDGQELCTHVADAPSMNHSYTGNNSVTRVYNPEWDTNMNGNYMFYSDVPWNWFCGVKKFLEAKNAGRCPASLIGPRLREVFTIDQSFQGTCD